MLVAFSVTPLGTGEGVGDIVAEAVRVVRESGLPSAEYSDESWSRRVGNVTPQHVGRLRRVYERFDAVREPSISKLVQAGKR